MTERMAGEDGSDAGAATSLPTLPHGMRHPVLALALAIASRIRAGRLTVVLPDGSRRDFAGAEPGPSGELRLRSERPIRRFLTGGPLAFAESYLDGEWDSPDLPRLLEVLALNESAYEEHLQGRAWYRALQRLRHLLRPNSRRGARRNIHAHYDLGNRFYASWLDPGMTYSAALFRPGVEDLEAAQRAKFESLARRIGLQPEERLLEIGCGWGGFALFAAAEVGARVTAITISPAQHAHASARIQAAGLGERVEVRLVDYRDVEGSFDRIASIEMFEAVGEAWWPVYFRRLGELLRPGGTAGLQIITIADRHFETYRRGVDFIQRYVFPGGMLPSPSALAREIAAAGLVEIGRHGFGQAYARTLSEWQQRFQAAWPEILELGFDARFKRIWEYYLAYCEAGFRVRFTDVSQYAIRRPI
jgi:cyclopropane-fatty-acyl-phospholipid synthase